MAERKSQRTQSKEPSPTSNADVAPGRPEVILEFLFDRGLLYISVRNIGNQPGIGVSVKFDKKILGLGGTKEISAMAVFKNIEFLGPQREILSLLDSSSSYFKRKQPTKISALVTYQDLEKRRYEISIKHDLEIYRDLVFVEPTKERECKCQS
ncbi:MAG: hypothetical protein ACRD9S_01580 [Pyrinomonadaceae bacterium]